MTTIFQIGCRKNNKIEIDKSQDVRNIATITDIQKFNDKLGRTVDPLVFGRCGPPMVIGGRARRWT